MLPDFLIGGAPKCATTSISALLAGHPDIFIPGRKELDFFQDNRNWEKGLDWYQSFFPESGSDRPGLIVGEATPDYLDSEIACLRIKEIIPNVKLVFILRNPIDRAYSHYLYRFSEGRELRSFRECIESHFEESSRPQHGVAYERRDYVTHFGFYGKYLNMYKNHFSSALYYVIILDDLLMREKTILHELYEFLGVKPIDLKLPKKNITQMQMPRSEWLLNFLTYSGKKRRVAIKWLRTFLSTEQQQRFFKMIESLNMKNYGKQPMKERDRELLVSLYQPDIEILSNILNRDMMFWLKNSGVNYETEIS